MPGSPLEPTRLTVDTAGRVFAVNWRQSAGGLFLALLPASTWLAAAEKPYDYHASKAQIAIIHLQTHL